MASPRRRPRHAAPAARPWPKRGRPSPEPRQRRGASIAARSAAPRGAGQGRPRSGGAMGAAYRGQGGRAMGGSGRREELGRARGKDGGRGGKRLQAIRRYDLLWTQGGVSNVLPYRPPFFCAPISGDDSPQARELDVEDGVGFRAERAKDFCGGDVRGDILRQDRHKRGLGIGDGRKGSVLWGIRAGRGCGRAAARHGDRGGQPFRTASFGRRGRLRRSAGRRQIPTLRSPPALLAARDLATPALAGRTNSQKILADPPTHPYI